MSTQTDTETETEVRTQTQAHSESKTSPSSQTQLKITVEFSGGLEILFANRPKHQVSLPAHQPSGRATTMAHLIPHVTQHLMVDSRKEMFVLDGTIRPGILVLINDADWELEGEEEYELKDRDGVLFVSTLHGG